VRLLGPEITEGQAMKNPARKPAASAPPPSQSDADLLLTDDPGELLDQAAQELIGGGGGTIRIERMKQGGKWEFVDEWELEVFSLSELQRAFGGGDYLLRLRDAQKRYFKQARVSVAEPQASKKDPAVVAAADPIAAAIAKQTELLAQLLAKLSTPPADMRASVLDDLVKFKTILGDGGARGGGFKETMETVTAVLAFSKEIGGGDGTTGWDVLKEAIAQAGGPVARAIESAVQTVRANAPGAAGGGAPRAALPGAAAAGESKPNEQGAAVNIPPRYVAMLVEKALEESDPVLYADLILDNVPEAMIRAVLAAGIVPTLGAIDARVPQSAQWFEQLGAVLSEALESVAHVSESGGAAPADS
jgi:hypothetical protein